MRAFEDCWTSFLAGRLPVGEIPLTVPCFSIQSFPGVVVFGAPVKEFGRVFPDRFSVSWWEAVRKPGLFFWVTPRSLRGFLGKVVFDEDRLPDASPA